MVSKVVLDFTNVKDGGTFSRKHMPTGDYRARITKVEDSPAKDGTPMLLFHIQLAATKSATYPYYCKLQENQLWKVRNLLVAAGFNVPKSKMKIDPSKLVNKEIAVTLDDDEYEGKMRSEISAVFAVSELEGDAAVDDDVDDEDEDDEDEEPPAKKKKKAAPVEEESEDDDDEEPEPPKKSKKKSAPEPEEDEEDEDEDEQPKKKSKKKAAPVDEDEDEIDIEDLDD